MICRKKVANVISVIPTFKQFSSKLNSYIVLLVFIALKCLLFISFYFNYFINRFMLHFAVKHFRPCPAGGAITICLD